MVADAWISYAQWSSVYSTESGHPVQRKPDSQSSDFGHECRSVATLLFCLYFVPVFHVKFAVFFLIDSPVSFILCEL